MLNEKKWIWEYDSYPNFTYDSEKLQPLLQEIKYYQGLLNGIFTNVNEEDLYRTQLEIMTQEIMDSSAIEGEILSRDSVRSSISNQLGINRDKQDYSTRTSDGVTELLVDAVYNFDKPLTEVRLLGWHNALFPQDVKRMIEIRIAQYRNEEMEIVSGRIGREKVHYVAPSAKALENEMEKFLEWLNGSEDSIVKAGIAHLWFVVIHPFDDGNGRIARSIGNYVLSKEAKIIAGPRSALFLPIEHLGLIVVDEEHDDSYKSSSRPRYNARDIAIYMGKVHDIPVLLGSATPSLTSYSKFPHVRLKGGHFQAQRSFIYERSREALSPLVLSSLNKTQEEKKQSIVFVPTRANFKYLICEDCGHTYECAFCSIGMSVHQKSHALKCHYCNFSQAIPQVCSECQSPNLTSSRLGTAQAVEEIQSELPNARVEQFDRDVITTQTKLKKALKRFNDKETDILVGTQMLSKGHDYHGVTLAIVLGMDNMLNMSDYRAREKALSSLIQVSGRSGRLEDAKVLVQSFNEDFFKAYLGKYELFLEDEKEFRKELYPPYKKLARVLFSHKNGHTAREAMEEMLAKLNMFSNVEIVGYGKCAIERVANKWRFEILLRGNKSTDLIKALRTSKVPLAEIDMDPIEFG